MRYTQADYEYTRKKWRDYRSGLTKAKDKLSLMLQTNHYCAKQSDRPMFSDDEIDQVRDEINWILATQEEYRYGTAWKNAS